jgi:predicted acyltransferase
VGRSTLLVYSIDMVLLWWIDSSVAVFTARFKFIGLFGSVVQALAVALMVWLVCLWLYRRQIVIKM